MQVLMDNRMYEKSSRLYPRLIRSGAYAITVTFTGLNLISIPYL